MRSLSAALLLFTVLSLSPLGGWSVRIIPRATPAASQARHPRTLASLIGDYRRGDTTAAIAEFATWDAKRVEAEVTAWETPRANASPLEPGDAGVRSQAALVMLRTGAAVQLDTFGITGRPISPGTPNHHQAAQRLVRSLTTRRGSADVRAFCRRWYILAASLWMRADQCARARDIVNEGLAALGDDAQLLLAAGSIAERQAVRERREEAGRCGPAWPSSAISWHGSYMVDTPTLSDARRFLQRAIALDPANAEARVRLGRVFFWGNNTVDAARELERALLDVPSADREFVGYVAALFLGQLHEEAHRLAEAGRAYEQAIAFNPKGYVAHLALGRLLTRSRRVEEGWASARAAFGETPDRSSPVQDPWQLYRHAQSWQAERLWREMDAWVCQ